MEIRLTLQRHCIETAAKKAYERLLGEYFQKSAAARDKIGLEMQIELLKRFLENADFAFLRNRYPELSGRWDTEVRLNIPENQSGGSIGFDRTIIPLEWKEKKR